MAFIWTSPDPLNNSAKTRSIYVVELQDAANVRLAELSQPLQGFIDQSIGKIYRVSSVEELKTVTAQLAIDFGYTGGIFNSELLGRDWVAYDYYKGLIITTYPIINDLRLVLDALEIQALISTPKFVCTSWYDNGLAGINPLGNWDITPFPWAAIPLDMQTGVGGVCPEGYPTCSNTIGGFFRGTILGVTEKSIIYISLLDNNYYEGPFGGPYYEVNGVSGLSTTTTPQANRFDEEYYYAFGNVAPDPADTISLQGLKRDGSNEGNLDVLGTITNPPGANLFDAESLCISEDHALVVAPGKSLGPGVFEIPRIVIFPKSGGAGVEYPVPFLNLGGATNFPPFTSNSNRMWLGLDWIADGAGGFNGVYLETWKDVSSFPGTIGVTSARINIDNTGGISVIDSDSQTVSTNTAIPSTYIRTKYGVYEGTADWFFIGDFAGDKGIDSAISAGSYYEIADPLLENLDEGGSIPGASTTRPTHEGTDYPTLDYKGDTIIQNISGCDNIEHWAMKGTGITPSISPVTIDSFTRTTNSVNITWTPTVGAFRYRLQRRLASSSLWTTTSIVESNDPAVGTGTITGLTNALSDYYARVTIETGQGLIEGVEELIPRITPDAPINLSVTPGVEEALLIWFPPVSGNPPTGYEVLYELVGAPSSTVVDVGNVTTFTVLGLTSGLEYSFRVRSYNAGGDGAISSSVNVFIL